jgi:hypothetical protein
MNSDYILTMAQEANRKSKFINGKFEIDAYPVQRGTTIKISSDELLLWVHGATSAIVDSKTYFQGKRRIPGPVVVLDTLELPTLQRSSTRYLDYPKWTGSLGMKAVYLAFDFSRSPNQAID